VPAALPELPVRPRVEEPVTGPQERHYYIMETRPRASDVFALSPQRKLSVPATTIETGLHRVRKTSGWMMEQAVEATPPHLQRPTRAHAGLDCVSSPISWTTVGIALILGNSHGRLAWLSFAFRTAQITTALQRACWL
jgi:hypothetical protein